MKNEITIELPKWILIVSGLFALLEFMVSLSLYIAPESVIESVDYSAKGVNDLIHMWAARQLALGVIFAFATFKKSAPMLTLSYLFLLIIFLGDLYLGISKNELPLIISALVMCSISAVMLFMLNRKNN